MIEVDRSFDTKVTINYVYLLNRISCFCFNSSKIKVSLMSLIQKEEGNKKARNNLHFTCCLDVLTEPSDTLSVSLTHDNGAHEDLKRAEVAIERNLALTGGLEETKGMSELILRDSMGLINLVTKNKEGNALELLDGKESIELSLRLSKSAGISSVNEVDNAANLGEIVSPQTTGLKMSTEIEGGELDVANSQLLRCYHSVRFMISTFTAIWYLLGWTVG